MKYDGWSFEHTSNIVQQHFQDLLGLTHVIRIHHEQETGYTWSFDHV
jgi:hypothetical protein